jgi:hypothetical protein
VWVNVLLYCPLMLLFDMEFATGELNSPSHGIAEEVRKRNCAVGRHCFLKDQIAYRKIKNTQPKG